MNDVSVITQNIQEWAIVMSFPFGFNILESYKNNTLPSDPMHTWSQHLRSGGWRTRSSGLASPLWNPDSQTKSHLFLLLFFCCEGTFPKCETAFASANTWCVSPASNSVTGLRCSLTEEHLHALSGTCLGLSPCGPWWHCSPSLPRKKISMASLPGPWRKFLANHQCQAFTQQPMAYISWAGCGCQPWGICV